MTTSFHDQVYLKYQVYNSLFLTLPFGSIYQTATLLPLLAMEAKSKLEQGSDPGKVINDFLEERFPHESEEVRASVLFDFIKYVERQVVLFDAIEDASFEFVHDMQGPGTITGLASRHKGNRDLRRARDFAVRIVMTAHPTQFYPGRVLSIISDLDLAIRNNEIAEIGDILLQLGKTPMVQKVKPTPFVEARRLIWYLQNVFYSAIGDMLEDLGAALDIPVRDLPLETMVRMGFWPGGDRDGNPFVDAETTWNVARRIKRTLMVCYYQELRKIRRKLTFRTIYGMVEAISAKLSHSISNVEEGYDSVEGLLADLNDVRANLVDDFPEMFTEILDVFIARVRIFGFHFATIDIRQDSSIHDALMKNIMTDEWQDLTEDDKIAALEQAQIDVNTLTIEDPVQLDVIRSMQVMADIVALNGERAAERYIISNTQSRVHILQMFHLMRWVHGEAIFGITPLFETIDDLAHAADIMRSLYNNDQYRKHLESRGMKQYIMLGFSDGTKDGGYLRANWSIFRAKEELTKVSREAGVNVVFFDGRGGPPARGGGKTHRFYASLGNTIEGREVQLTVQGQTISSNFGTEQSARYNLEQLFTAGVNNVMAGIDAPALDKRQREVMEEIAEISYTAYKNFKNDPDFLPYLEQLGTLPYYGMTNIGSRPVKRSNDAKLTLKSLRAIPFVGSWNQMKQNVPGFYGVGTALKHMKDRGKIDFLKSMYRDCLFFRTLVENSMMSLTKSYFPLTQYLANHPKFGRIWRMIYEEYKLTEGLLLEVAEQNELLESNSNALASIRLREQIVLPVLVIQQYALQRIRELESDNKVEQAGVYHSMVMRTMFAIINAGRNSA